MELNKIKQPRNAAKTQERKRESGILQGIPCPYNLIKAENRQEKKK